MCILGTQGWSVHVADMKKVLGVFRAILYMMGCIHDYVCVLAGGERGKERRVSMIRACEYD